MDQSRGGGLALDRGTASLLSVVQELSTVRNDQQIRAIAARAARELLDADGATFVLRDGDRCYYVEENAIGPLWKGRKFPLSSCISGWAMLNGQAAIVPDIYRDDRVPHDAYRATFVHSLVMVPIRAADPIGAIGVYWADQRDPTEREVALAQALADTTAVAIENVRLINDLEARVRARTAQLEQLLGVVSHELRSPLLAVLATLEMLAEDGLPDDALTSVRVAQRNTDRMLHIANDLIDLDRHAAGTLRVRPEQVSTTDIAHRVTDTSAPLARTANIQLSVEVDDHRFTADPQRITQALVNLVGNAIKFSPPGATVALTSTHDRDVTTFVVADRGRGIPPEQTGRIFDWHAQVSPDADSRLSHGAGLGLAITQAIVQAHHGTITVHSTPSEGTRFTIRLPERATNGSSGPLPPAQHRDR